MYGTVTVRNPDGTLGPTTFIGQPALAPETVKSLAAIFAEYLLSDEKRKEETT